MSGLEGRILTLVKSLEEEKRLADKRAKQLYLAGASFIGHGDTPATYVGQAGKFVKVNAVPDALVFADIVWGDVSKAGSNLTDLATRQHAGLTNITENQHHNKLHSMTGVAHSASGLTIGWVIRATGAGTFAWGMLTKLGTVSAGTWQASPIANAYIAGIDQNLLTTSSPTHVTAKLTALSNGYVPYHVSDAAGLANSPIRISGTDVGIGVIPTLGKLHIVPGFALVALATADPDGRRIEFVTAGVGGATPAEIRTAGTASGLLIKSALGGYQLFLKDDGNVGIGKVPTAKLDVNGALKVATIAAGTADYDKFLVSHGGLVKYRTGAQVLSDIGAGGGYLGAPTQLTISGGVITVTGCYHKVETQGGAGTDNLVTILGGLDGQILVLRTAYNTHDVTVKDGDGNIQLLAGDFVMGSTVRKVYLFYDADWGNWQEISIY